MVDCVYRYRSGLSVVAEQSRFYAEADADVGVVLFLVKEAFAVAVVVLDEKVLVVTLEKPVVQFHKSVVV